MAGGVQHRRVRYPCCMSAPFVIVTGASQGIGRATVLALVREHGAQVLAVARNGAALRSLQEEAGEQSVEILALDQSAREAPEQVRAAVNGRRVHGLVHNAGQLLKRPFGQYDAEDLHHLFAVNVFAPVLLTQALCDNLEGREPGHVVHVASMGGFQDSVKFPGLAGYSSSKAALACLSQCLAEELKNRGIRSNCLALGAVDTLMLRQAFPDHRATTTAEAMGGYIAWFTLHGHKLFNGKVLPVSDGTP